MLVLIGSAKMARATSTKSSAREDLYTRYSRRGIDTGLEMNGDKFVDRVLELEALDPEWAQGFVNWVYGTVYPRRVLDPKVRALITVGQHIALGNWRAMVTHVKAALHFGATRQELIEVCLTSSVYAGFPKAHEGLAVFYRAEQEFLSEQRKRQPRSKARRTRASRR
jgi:4-carboxymuconolactone decarboxylase